MKEGMFFKKKKYLKGKYEDRQNLNQLFPSTFDSICKKS